MTMPERSRLPYAIEMQDRIERMERAREAEHEALMIVTAFNARLVARKSPGFWPTIETAFVAKYPWLQVLCQSCGGVTDLDLRVKPRAPDTPIIVALRDVKCPRCNGHGGPRIVGLAPRASI
jgi:hypothetical protein